MPKYDFDEIQSKCFKAIESCKTHDQLEVATRYVMLFLRLLSNEGDLPYSLMVSGFLTGATFMKHNSLVRAQTDGNKNEGN